MAPGPSGHIGYHTRLSSPQRPCLKLCGCRPGRCLLRCTECSSSTMPFYSRLPPSRLHKLSLFAQPLPPDITARKPPVGLGEICSPLVRPSFESSRDPGNSETGALGTRENPRRMHTRDLSTDLGVPESAPKVQMYPGPGCTGSRHHERIRSTPGIRYTPPPRSEPHPTSNKK